MNISRDIIFNSLNQNRPMGGYLHPGPLSSKAVTGDHLLELQYKLELSGAKWGKITHDNGISEKVAELTKNPAELEKVEYLTVCAEFAVASSGAIWIDFSSIDNPGKYLFSRNLVIILEPSNIVANWNEAFRKLNNRMTNGTFISGPAASPEFGMEFCTPGQGPVTLIVLFKESRNN